MWCSVVHSFLIFLLVTGREAFADINEYRLYDDLMRNYKRQIRPSLNHTQPSNVSFGLLLSQIIDVDEKNQILTTNCWLNQNWFDYNLTWEPKNYGGLDILHLPADDVWKPDILLYNNAEVMSYLNLIDSNVAIHSDGNVTWLSMAIFRSSCSINVQSFPFDEQSCQMKFASWAYDGFQINLLAHSKTGDTSNFLQNSEWELISLEAVRNITYYSCCAEPYPDLTFYIVIRRRPLFYVFNLMFPCLLLTLVALLGFYIPSNSGEKVTVGITTLLSMTVFLMIVAEQLPPTKSKLPLLGLYYGITIGIVSSATAMTVLTLNIHHLGHHGRRVPWFIRRMCFDILAVPLFMRNEVHRLRKWRTQVDPKEVTVCNTGLNEGDTGNRVHPSNATHAAQDREGRSNLLTPNCSPVMSRHQNFYPMSTLPNNICNTTSTDRNAYSTDMQFLHVMKNVLESIEASEMRQNQGEQVEVAKAEWQLVALIVDRMLLWVFLTFTITTSLALVIQALYYNQSGASAIAPQQGSTSPFVPVEHHNGTAL